MNRDIKLNLRPTWLLRYFLTSVSLLVSLVLSGCKKGLEVNHAGYIVGLTNDIVQVTPANRSAIPDSVFDSAVFIVTKLPGERVKYCSGTLVEPARPGENLRVLTNHHCFAEIDKSPGGSDIIRGEVFLEACTNTETWFGVAPSLGVAPTKVGCQPGTLRTNPKLDLAVFTLARAVPGQHRAATVAQPSMVEVGRAAMIVHYPEVESHLAPLPGQPVALPTASVTLEDCKILGVFPEREWGIDPTVPYSLRHSCDIVQGSSGSALLDAETHEIIGVNWGGIKINHEKGQRTDNVATRTEFVAAFLAGQEIPQPLPVMDSGRNADAVAGIPEKRKQTSGGIKGVSCGVTGSHVGAHAFLFLLLVLPVFLVTHARAQDKQGTTVKSEAPVAGDPALQWIDSHLLATAMALEFVAVAETPQDPPVAPEALKGLWMRAHFALGITELRGQKIFGRSKVARLLRERTAVVTTQMTRLEKDLWTDKKTLKNDLERQHAALGSSWQSPVPWSVLAPIMHAEIPPVRCNLTRHDLQAFAEAQRKLQAGGRTPTPAELLALNGKRDDARTRCLVLALGASPGFDSSDKIEASAWDYAPLLTAMQQAGNLSDPVLRRALALRHVQTANWAEALRLLVELQEEFSGHRFTWDSVQRIFSLRQRGAGDVALKGL